MSGFRRTTPQAPPLEFRLWHVTKETEHAEARVRVRAHGRELSVTVNGALMFSRVFRVGESGRALGDESTATLENFLTHGWTLSPDRGTRHQ
jgi:hypothetical protein